MSEKGKRPGIQWKNLLPDREHPEWHVREMMLENAEVFNQFMQVVHDMGLKRGLNYAAGKQEITKNGKQITIAWVEFLKPVGDDHIAAVTNPESDKPGAKMIQPTMCDAVIFASRYRREKRERLLVFYDPEFKPPVAEAKKT